MGEKLSLMFPRGQKENIFSCWEIGDGSCSVGGVYGDGGSDGGSDGGDEDDDGDYKFLETSYWSPTWQARTMN